MLATAMLSLSNSGKKAFDTEIALKNVYVETGMAVNKAGESIVKYTRASDASNGGVKLTSSLLEKLSAEDLPGAIDLMSQLYKAGELSSSTTLKLFERRWELAS